MCSNVTLERGKEGRKNGGDGTGEEGSRGGDCGGNV